MDTTPRVEWFEGGDERRSVLFAIAMAAGFLSIVAGVSTMLATAQLAVGVALFVLGLAVFALATAIAAGHLDEYLLPTSESEPTEPPTQVDESAS